MHHSARWLSFVALAASCAPRATPDASMDSAADAAADAQPQSDAAENGDAVDDLREDSTDARAHDVVQDASDSAADAREAGRDTSRDITLRFNAAASHPDRLVEALLVDEANVSGARVVLRGFNMLERVPLRSALPMGRARFDWFVDRSGDLLYQPPPADDSYRTDIVAGPAPLTVDLPASSALVDITRAPSTSRTLFGRFTEFEPHVGVFFQIEIEPEGREETVALFRYRALPAAGRFDFALRAVLVSGQRYTARWFIDLNDNEVYDPRGDHGGNLSFAATDADLTLVHEHHANRAWIE